MPVFHSKVALVKLLNALLYSHNGTMKAITSCQSMCPYMDALKIFGISWLRPRLLFPKIFVAFVPIDPVIVRSKFEVRQQYYDAL